MNRTRKQTKRLGHYLMTCDYSGFVGWDDEMRETWDGKFVLKQFWEPRHPQDYVKGAAETSRPDNVRVEPEAEFVSDLYPNGVTKDDL